jgi:hypothetical protein
MRFQCLVSLLLVGAGFQQAVQSAPSSGAGAKAAEAMVGPDDPVITLDGFCADSAQQGGACKTVITRAQFEKLTEALQPGMSMSLRLTVANAYARNLRMSAAAEKRGLDKTPAFEEEMRYARMQLLSQDLNHALLADANDVSDADLEDYYKMNEGSYDQATVARIFVPHAKQIVAAHEAHGNSRSADAQSAVTPEDAMTRVAADLRTRAVSGEDPDKLQIEAYAEAGMPRTSANTKIEKVRRATLPPAHEAVLDLRPGETSEVFSDPAGAHFIYKMLGKQRLSLEEVKSEIRGAISSQRYRDGIKAFQGDVVFSDAYFNPPATPDGPPLGERARYRQPDDIVHTR